MRRKKLDIVNKRFERLIVIRFSHVSDSRRTYWFVKCDCGNTKIVRGTSLRSGNTKSCGCLQKEVTIKRIQTHGLAGTPTYKSWWEMVNRCLDKNVRKYKDYAGRGIKVCDRWLESFENFLADMGERPESKTLDRINNDGNYELLNCRWSTLREQQNNTRANVLIKHDSRTQTIAQWARELDINYATLVSRFNRKWSVERAFTKKQKQFNG